MNQCTRGRSRILQIAGVQSIWKRHRRSSAEGAERVRFGRGRACPLIRTFLYFLYQNGEFLCILGDIYLTVTFKKGTESKGQVSGHPGHSWIRPCARETREDREPLLGGWHDLSSPPKFLVCPSCAHQTQETVRYQKHGVVWRLRRRRCSRTAMLLNLGRELGSCVMGISCLRCFPWERWREWLAITDVQVLHTVSAWSYREWSDKTSTSSFLSQLHQPLPDFLHSNFTDLLCAAAHTKGKSRLVNARSEGYPEGRPKSLGRFFFVFESQLTPRVY